MAEKKPHCATCPSKDCYQGRDCFDAAYRHRPLYDGVSIRRMHEAAATLEARHYGSATRLEELILFAQDLGFTKIGLAFCVGLSEEAKTLHEILSDRFDVVSVCCKVSGISKAELGLERVHPERDAEAMCNPAGQAELLNRAGTELNVICGLCVGHDAIFSMTSKAPVTTFLVKDRVLAHNPAGALYCRYIKRRFKK